jgi:replication factor C small subunit
MIEKEAQSIWTEKYRPKEFSEIKGQKEAVKRVKAFVQKKNMPHLMFAGPAGIGKTTMALVIAKQLFGNSWRDNTLELNASDERGIDVVRVKVKDFARTRAIGNVPFKLIYLDECDALTKEAQQALRRTMENYTQTCRFILSCNYSSKIIDPIQSRCAVFRFKLLSKEEIKSIVDKIKKDENLEITEKGFEALYEASNGDVRRLENVLQSCAAIKNKITEDLVFSVASLAKPKEILELLQKSCEGNFLAAKKLLFQVMLEYGLSGLDVIKQIQQKVWDVNEKMANSKQKLEIIKLCGDIEFRLVEGSDEFIQLEALIAKIGAVCN